MRIYAYWLKIRAQYVAIATINAPSFDLPAEAAISSDSLEKPRAIRLALQFGT